MNRLQCVGRLSGVSSKDNEKEVAPSKPVIGSSTDPVAKESVEWKPEQQKPKPSGRTRGQDLSINYETTNIKAPSSTRQPIAKPSEKREKQDPSIKTEGNPSLNSETSSTSHKEHNSKSSRGYNASKAPSFRNVTTHGHKLPKQVPPMMTEKQGECEVQSESVLEKHIQAPQVVSSANDQDPHEAQSEEEETESAEGHVPLELFAEFLQAVMTKNYPLAKKLCQMILIYEPQNSEAKSFQPLIEEKLLIEAEEESDDDDDDEFDTSDDDEDDVEDDDDESTDSSDTDEESTESTDDTLSS
ncbi:glutamate-rich protein 2 isoform X1 [Rhinichthys klamathensis goyatoka]|uniref:glutamate-rich protein 2 isoform X1 n=1 Tax=Rhinichthys klamathensis goyatoka TaxID=3034132 RepID=UPI0024B5BF72|nr:glutamate-rich protein 2 isoform X1 [Rhinichthys klamathensis goyatoka]